MENRRVLINELINAAIASVQPEHFIPQVVKVNGSTAVIGGTVCDFSSVARVYTVAIGKAAVGMTDALNRLIGHFISEGIVLTKHIPENTSLPLKYHVMCGGHPVPTEDSVRGAKAILDLLSRTEANDLVIFLISGGGSALMTAPINGIDLETYRRFNAQILSCGADIKEFNTLRKHLDAVKGGRLAQAAAPARQITIILSDVVGSPVDVIASGPTVPDSSTFADAAQILDKYSGRTEFQREIVSAIRLGADGKLPETLKAEDPSFARSEIILAAENRTAAYAAAQKGLELGLHSAVLNTRVTGEASEIGTLLPSFFSEMKRPGLLVFGGETTVHLHGNGLGGRNLETALGAVRGMSEYSNCALVTLATDGEDGPTDAAGAIVTSETLANALAAGLVPEEYLRNNDSYHFFEKAGGLLKPGSTGTNVNDLTFLLAF